MGRKKQKRIGKKQRTDIKKENATIWEMVQLNALIPTKT